MTSADEALKEQLDQLFDQFHVPQFISDDPICIPHRFVKKQDIEIAGFWTAMLSWGNRTTIINKASELMDLMDNSPYEFICQHQPSDRRAFSKFVHRTFQFTDTLYFLAFFQAYYQVNQSLEQAFLGSEGRLDLAAFHETFFGLPDVPKRTRKHVSTPLRKSRCKRINMFLRWMVRSSKGGVDFGIWRDIKPAQLYIPLDVHVDRVARSFGLIKRKQSDWHTVLELTDKLRTYDPLDPVKYDFALFGTGVLQRN